MGDLLLIGLDILSQHTKSKCIFCHSKFPTPEMISINHIKKDVNFKYMNSEWVIYHLILEDKVDRLESTNVALLCSDCYRERLSKVKRKYTDAYSKMNQVKTYPASYQGRFKLDSSVEPKIETYHFSGGKWNTVNKMKFWAAWEGYDIIYNITYEYDLDGNTVTGVFAKLEKPKQ